MAPKPPNGNHHPLPFALGALIFSPSIDRLMREGNLDPLPYFQRHTHGDWGDVSDNQWQSNNAALKTSDRLESSYTVHREMCICIFTDADRSATHIVLASEQ